MMAASKALLIPSVSPMSLVTKKIMMVEINNATRNNTTLVASNITMTKGWVSEKVVFNHVVTSMQTKGPNPFNTTCSNAFHQW